MIRRYKDSDYGMIKKWAKSRGMLAPKAASLSTLGYICDERVAGWIYLTDSNIAFIDGVISNPDTVPSFRRMALKKLCGAMVEKAQQMGYTNIIATTKHPAIQKICEDMGFVTAPDFKIYALREGN
jgi:hypothetical protein